MVVKNNFKVLKLFEKKVQVGVEVKAKIIKQKITQFSKLLLLFAFKKNLNGGQF